MDLRLTCLLWRFSYLNKHAQRRWLGNNNISRKLLQRAPDPPSSIFLIIIIVSIKSNNRVIAIQGSGPSLLHFPCTFIKSNKAIAPQSPGSSLLTFVICAFLPKTIRKLLQRAPDPLCSVFLTVSCQKQSGNCSPELRIPYLEKKLRSPHQCSGLDPYLEFMFT